MRTARQERERAYYDVYSQDKSRVEVCFDPIAGKEQRPWNPYWYLFGRVKAAYAPGARLLDFGCGWGENAVVFARIGYDVYGFDISEGNLRTARALAERYGLGPRMHFSVQAAENLGYAADQFDVIAGIDILHHVDVAAAIRECYRVLKPGGMAVFREPVHNAVFDTLRNLRPVRRLVPNSASFERHITADERKLTAADIRAIRGVFDQVEVRPFRVLSRLEKFFPRAERFLERVDYYGSAMPGYSSLRGTVVLTLRKAPPAAARA